MNYFTLDFSGSNATAPKKEEMTALLEVVDKISHEYSMSYSTAPQAALDYFVNARTDLEKEPLLKLLNRTFRHPPRVIEDTPSRVTIRGTTVEQEFEKKG